MVHFTSHNRCNKVNNKRDIIDITDCDLQTDRAYQSVKGK